jgi:diketogulonate reductase-like aldo/keto reductase
LPYEASDPLERQIKSSVESSLWNFRLRDGVSWQEDAYIDSMLLHTPMGDMRGTLIAWRIFESYVPLKIRHLGLSNVKLTALQTVFDEAVMKPMIVQNPFCSASGFDKQIRAFCQSRGLIYQSFWTLSANRAIVGAEFITRLAPKIGVCPEVVMYALVMNLGIVVLNGTKDESRMRSDLQEVILVEYWAEENAEDWARVVEAFTALLQIADP